MENKLRQIEQEALFAIGGAKEPDELQAIRVEYLGRKGLVTTVISELGKLSDEERPRIGRLANSVKEKILSELEYKSQELSKTKKPKAAVSKETDFSLPGVSGELGHMHIVTKTIQNICEIFLYMGFRIVEGPEIETEYYNFQALNIPLEHPSRDVFDTFYLDTKQSLACQQQQPGQATLNTKLLLRSHTSPVQIRFMEKNKPPFNIIVPGKVFRPDAVDASHSFMFHQIEGLIVDTGIRFSDLKGVLETFAKRFFGQHIKMRFRPHFFPFTEPSAEVDISCIICNGSGCRVCSNKGWLEILGAGMVDPEVFKYVKIDSERYTGFAFGMGVERIAMLKYGIDDIRLFFENDLRFLRQF